MANAALKKAKAAALADMKQEVANEAPSLRVIEGGNEPTITTTDKPSEEAASLSAEQKAEFKKLQKQVEDGAKALSRVLKSADRELNDWLAIGRGLIAARKLYPHNVKFSAWRKESIYAALDARVCSEAQWLANNWDDVQAKYSDVCEYHASMSDEPAPRMPSHPTAIHAAFNSWSKPVDNDDEEADEDGEKNEAPKASPVSAKDAKNALKIITKALEEMDEDELRETALALAKTLINTGAEGAKLVVSIAQGS